MKTQLSKEDQILRAVKLGKRSTFGLTGIKIELEGNLSRSYSNWEDTEDCDNWFWRRFESMGLAVEDHDEDSGYRPVHPLVYSNFYNDGSVDSEITLTISLKENENIFLVPKMVELWNEFVEEVGGDIDIRNAGMHMTLLNNPDCFYGHDYRPTMAESQRFVNFQRAMNPLMPALFFLGSTNDRSRSLHFRAPQVSTSKYSAIHYVGGALEFRVFETCYDDPERTLDNFMVMRSCLRFWQDEYVSPNLAKIARRFKFGNDDDDSVSRFYKTPAQLDFLNAGLVKIKPAYLSVSEIKKQRGFNVTKRILSDNLKQVQRDAVVSYKEYEDRFLWSVETQTSRESYYQIECRSPRTAEDRERCLAEAEQATQTFRERQLANKRSLQQHINTTLATYNERCEGNFTLEVA